VPSPPIITLTSDFGLRDPYVAAMKGVILDINPTATMVDVSHDVEPQRVAQGAFVLGAALPYFPRGTVHLAVVDPGVGGERRGLVLATPRGLFVGPDNGLLSPALPDEARAGATEPGQASAVPLPEGHRAFAITRRQYMREPVSTTFHGRDVFAPVAAHLSLGVDAEESGERVDSVLAFPPFRARRRADGGLEGRVLHVDRFGNLVTDVRAEDLPAGGVWIEIGGQVIRGLRRTYEEAGGLAALVGSSGYLEVALPGGSAAAELGVDIGDPALVKPA
jgi:S-adenosylmethionine hydrolase